MKQKPLAIAAAAAGFLTLASLGTGSDRARAQSADAHAEGRAVFEHWCAPCHAPGPGHPGTQSLAIKYQGTDIPAPLEAREDLTAPVVRTFVRQGILSMAPFRKTEITDAELEALAAYLTSRGD